MPASHSIELFPPRLFFVFPCELRPSPPQFFSNICCFQTDYFSPSVMFLSSFSYSPKTAGYLLRPAYSPLLPKSWSCVPVTFLSPPCCLSAYPQFLSFLKFLNPDLFPSSIDAFFPIYKGRMSSKDMSSSPLSVNPKLKGFLHLCLFCPLRIPPVLAPRRGLFEMELVFPMVLVAQLSPPLLWPVLRVLTLLFKCSVATLDVGLPGGTFRIRRRSRARLPVALIHSNLLNL